MAILAAAAPTQGGQVEGRILRVGLFAGATPVVRSGNWCLIEVNLRWNGEKALDAELRVDQLDRDGDVGSFFMSAPLTPDGQWHRYEVYFVPHDFTSRDTVRVRLFDGEGRLVKMLDQYGEEVASLVSPPVYDLSADELLIVDLTQPRRLEHVTWLDSTLRRKIGYMNVRTVRAMSPRELPSRWEGLEAVDAIVWDNADPSELSQRQISALVAWVEGGGRLLLTAGSNWQALAESSLAQVLPVTITGADDVTEAQEFLPIVNNHEYNKRLDRHYSKNPITRCRMSPLPGDLPIPADSPNPQIAHRRLLGRGSLIFVGASLRELLPIPTRLARQGENTTLGEDDDDGDDPFVRVCEEVVGRRFLALPEVQEEKGGMLGLTGTHNLFQTARGAIGFRSLGAAFMFFAILFAIAYTLFATLGSYWLLRRRGWQHRSWIAFALVAAAGSVIGTGMVWVLRGVTTKVWQVTVLDGQAGVDYGQATCLFGVKTPDHTRLGLRLPVGSGDDATGRRYGALRTMPEAVSLETIESRFVAPENYRSDVVHARLLDVPLRATLKEFLGKWHGPLGGTLDAKLVERRTGSIAIPYEFADGSYIRNNLGVDLHDCYILETREDFAESAARVHCFRLGDLPKSGPASTLEGEQVRQALFFERMSGDGPNDPPVPLKSRPFLRDRIKSWLRELPGNWSVATGEIRRPRLTADQEVVSLMLLSVFDLVRQDLQPGLQLMRRSHGRSLGCTHRISSRTAVLIGWSDDPPPSILEIDRADYVPDKSRTIYRFVIPVERPK